MPLQRDLQPGDALPWAGATTDRLTGLANQLLFASRLDMARARLRRNGQAFALLILDIDGFRQINNAFGPAGGDELLRQFARRLQSAFRPGDMIARLGGNDFAILVENLAARTDPEIFGDRILGLLTQPFQLRGSAITLAVSIGIASGEPNQGATSATLRLQANAAMHDAKLQSGSFYRSFPSLLTRLAQASADENVTAAE